MLKAAAKYAVVIVRLHQKYWKSKGCSLVGPRVCLGNYSTLVLLLLEASLLCHLWEVFAKVGRMQITS